MDIFYEESATNQKAKKGEKIYKVFHYISWTFFILAIMVLIFDFMVVGIPLKPKEANYETYEKYLEAENAYPGGLFMFFFVLSIGVSLLLIGVLFLMIKRRINLQYDYIFVSGELRIAKIFNINRRKFLEKIDCEDIQQMGDVENSSFDRLAAAPGVKIVRYSANALPADGKFFMYIVTKGNNKKLYVLECRETLLMNLLKFTRRSALESDYVMQEKKQR